MKKTLLSVVGVGALAFASAQPAEAALFVQLTQGVSSVSCNNSTAAGVAACLANGFNTALDANVVTSAGLGGITVGSYSLVNFSLLANVPGNAFEALTGTTELGVTNSVAGNSLNIDFAAFNFTMPTGPLTLSASQTANYTTSSAGDSKSFTGYGRADNGLTPGGTAAPTPTLVSTGCSTCSFASQSPDVAFTRLATPFSLVGAAVITQATTSRGLYTQTVRVEAVPEPASMLLLGTGLLGLARAARRRRQAA